MRELVAAPPDRARQLASTRSGSRARRRRRSRSSRSSASSTRSASRSATRATSPPTGRASRRPAHAAADARLPGRGRRAARLRRAGREPRDGRQRDPDRQPGALGGGDGGDDRVARARSARSPTTRSSTPTACSPRTRASSASRPRASGVAGLLSTAPRARARIVCVLTGHGLKDPQTALDQAGARRALRAGHRRGRAGRARVVKRRRRRPRPGLVGEPRAGLRRPSRRRWRCTSSVEVVETGRFARPDRPAIARDRRNLVVRGFARLHPPDDFEFRIASDIPLSRRARHERGGLRRRPAGRRLDLRARRRPARARDRARGPSRQRRRGAARRLRAVRRRRGDALRPARRARGGARRARDARVRTAKARAALPAEVPLADAVFNVAHAALLVLGLAQGDLDLVARGLARPPAPAAPRAPVPARRWRCVERARELGALGATISGAGPTVLVWSRYERPRASWSGCGRETDGLGGRAARAVRADGRRRARRWTSSGSPDAAARRG